jgi:hypothetical protein
LVISNFTLPGATAPPDGVAGVLVAADLEALLLRRARRVDPEQKGGISVRARAKQRPGFRLDFQRRLLARLNIAERFRDPLLHDREWRLVGDKPLTRRPVSEAVVLHRELLRIVVGNTADVWTDGETDRYLLVERSIKINVACIAMAMAIEIT